MLGPRARVHVIAQLQTTDSWQRRRSTRKVLRETHRAYAVLAAFQTTKQS
jgi:hypothetical protein